MIDRDKLPYIQNILSLHNNDVNLDLAYKVITSLNERNMLHFFNYISGHLNNLEEFKTICLKLLEGEKESNLYDFYINLLKITNKDLNVEYLSNVLKASKRYKDKEQDILDSFSPNQMTSKTHLLESVKKLGILNEDYTVVIWGCWYGSILIPYLQRYVKKIVGIDIDNRVLKLAKNNLFKQNDNVDFIETDVFKKHREIYLDTNLIINTSCEHMLPMREWPWFQRGAIDGDDTGGTVWSTPKLNSNCYFAFQSNNMFGIEGHINCVNSLQEFEDQMPERAQILHREEIEDTRGTRYMLVGKFIPL